MLTPSQIKTLRAEFAKLSKLDREQFDDAWYQTAIRNCGARPDPKNSGRLSCKTLDNAGFEKFMAIVEQVRNGIAGTRDTYWQDRNAARTGRATTRQAWEIRRLHDELAKTPKSYPLYALCRRMSHDEHSEPEQLTSAQANSLIEALKAMLDRPIAPTPAVLPTERGGAA